jgi:hypothetical protein
MNKLLFLPLILLTGCTPYTTEFRCPIGQGLPCHSMSQVHSSLAGTGVTSMGETSQIYLPPQSAPLIAKEASES